MVATAARKTYTRIATQIEQYIEIIQVCRCDEAIQCRRISWHPVCEMFFCDFDVKPMWRTHCIALCAIVAQIDFIIGRSLMSQRKHTDIICISIAKASIGHRRRHKTSSHSTYTLPTSSSIAGSIETPSSFQCIQGWLNCWYASSCRYYRLLSHMLSFECALSIAIASPTFYGWHWYLEYVAPTHNAQRRNLYTLRSTLDGEVVRRKFIHVMQSNAQDLNRTQTKTDWMKWQAAETGDGRQGSFWCSKCVNATFDKLYSQTTTDDFRRNDKKEMKIR